MIQNKHHDLDCCDHTRGVDKLFNSYKKDTDFITNLMVNDPDQLINNIWSHDSPLCIDIKCRCRMGEGDRRSQFSCSQCKNICKIKDFRKEELVFMIKCGYNTGKTMIILPHEITNLFLCYDAKITEKAKVYFTQSICNEKQNNDLHFISGDKFTNRILIMLMITKIFREKKLPHILNLYTAFICNNKGYSLMDDPTIGSFDKLHELSEYHTKCEYGPLICNITKSIIYQLIVIINELSYINFTHGNPSIESLVLSKENISYKYEGINVEGIIALKIINMWDSSATFSKNHYFSKNVKVEINMECNMFVPQFEIAKINNYKVYRLNKDNINTYMAMNRIGISMYNESFDLYCFFVSLMCDKSFYISVMKDDKLYNIWKSMWISEELQKVEELINKQHLSGVNNFETTLKIILGFWLRCDIVKYLMTLIKMK